jgi:glyoxylase-like metal-dependent hydrolase (beta-lactamase superfamily II)
MKQLHKSNLWMWSEFNEEKNIDFNGFLWCRDAGNILIDPVPLSAHDHAHLTSLGGVASILITNSDHIRAAYTIANEFKATLYAPLAEKSSWSGACEHWLSEGDTLFPGIDILEMQGSKTPGELAFILDDETLIAGDLVRSHQAGVLMLLPNPKLTDSKAAHSSVLRLTKLQKLQHVLVGDGWCHFHNGRQLLTALASKLT